MNAHLASIADERARVRAGQHGPDHDRTHGGVGHLAVQVTDRLCDLDLTDPKTWVQVGQFALAALELLDGAEAGTATGDAYDAPDTYDLFTNNAETDGGPLFALKVYDDGLRTIMIKDDAPSSTWSAEVPLYRAPLEPPC